MRRRRADKREVMPDLQYNSKTVAQLISMVMVKGKKSIAQKIVYGALEAI